MLPPFAPPGPSPVPAACFIILKPTGGVGCPCGRGYVYKSNYYDPIRQSEEALPCCTLTYPHIARVDPEGTGTTIVGLG